MNRFCYSTALGIAFILFGIVSAHAQPAAFFKVGLKDFELNGNVEKVEYQSRNGDEAEPSTRGVLYFNQQGDLYKEEGEFSSLFKTASDSDTTKMEISFIYDDNSRLIKINGRYNDGRYDYDITLKYLNDETLPRIAVTKETYMSSISKYLYDQGNLSKEVILYFDPEQMSIESGIINTFKYNAGGYLKYLESLSSDNYSLTTLNTRDENNFIVQTVQNVGYSNRVEDSKFLHTYPVVDSHGNWLEQKQVDADTGEVIQVRSRVISYY